MLVRVFALHLFVLVAMVESFILRSRLHFRHRQFICITQCQLHNDNPNSDQFAQWEAEELEDVRAEQKSQLLELRKEMEGEALPSYMLDLMGDYGVIEESSEPVTPAKLPVLAVIGRPNTGKSTLVNRIANTFKVLN